MSTAVRFRPTVPLSLQQLKSKKLKMNAKLTKKLKSGTVVGLQNEVACNASTSRADREMTRVGKMEGGGHFIMAVD